MRNNSLFHKWFAGLRRADGWIGRLLPLLLLLVVAAGIGHAQSITKVSPNVGLQGQTIKLSVTGSGTHFSRTSVLTFSGSGISVITGTVGGSSTLLTAEIVITATAPLGPQTVTVTSGAEIVSLTNGFTIVPGYAVSVTGSLGLVGGPDPLKIAGSQFTLDTAINPSVLPPIGQIAGGLGTQATYNGLQLNLTSPTFALIGTCSSPAATAVINLYNTAVEGVGDTIALSNCQILGIAPFTAVVGYPTNGIPTPIPAAFNAGIVAPTLTSLVISQVTVSGSSAVYSYSSANGPALAAGMGVAVAGFTNASNNGVFVITAVAPGTFTVALAPPPNSQITETHAATGNGYNSTYGSVVQYYCPGIDCTALSVSGSTAASCAGCPPITVTPPAGGLTFTTPAGSSPSPETVQVTSTGTLDWAPVVSGGVANGITWLSVTPTTGTTPGSFTVNVSSGALAAGNYSANVIVYTSGSNSPQTLPVSLTVTPPAFQLVATPPSFTFNAVTGMGAQTGSLSVTTSPTLSVAYTAVTDGSPWLSISAPGGTTGGPPITVTADPTKVTAGGTYTGKITLTSTGATNSPLVVNVTFNFTAVAPSPTSLTFNASVGGSPSPQNLSVTSTSTLPNVGFTATATSTGNWLAVSPSSGTSNTTTLSVSVSTAGLIANTYNGTINITPTGATTPIAVPVKLVVTNAPVLISDQNSLTFNSANGAVPAAQTLNMSSSAAPTQISYTVAASSTGGWLAVSPASGTTPQAETVSIVPAVLPTLATGTYNGSVVFTYGTGSTLTVNVTLVVSAAISASPNPVTFNYTVAGSVPAAQPIAVTSSGGPIAYTATVVPGTGGAWLAVAPGSATTPTGISASLNPAVLSTLGAGKYTASITLAGTATNSPYSIPVTLNVNPEPTLVLTPSGQFNFNMTYLGSLPVAQPLAISASNGGAIPFTATVTSGTWLSVAPSGGTTPGNVSIAILANSLAPGQYTGTVQIASAQASNSPQNVTVVLNVSAAPNLTPSQTSLTFAFQVGQSNPPPQNLTITSTGAALAFTAVANSTGGWLSITPPASGTTPQTLVINVNPAGLAANTYQGSIVVTSAQAGNSPLTVPVTLTVSTEPSIVATPSALSFSYTILGTVPGAKPVAVTSTGTALTITSSTTTPWLSVTQTGTTTPNVSLSVALNPAGLASLTPGTYNGVVAIAAAGAANTPLNYPVTLTVSAQASLSVAPTSMTFNGQVGASNPASQTLTVGGVNGTLSFTAAAATTSGGSWLSVSPTAGTTNAGLTVSVNIAGLTAGPYAGSVVITAAGASNSPVTVPVTLTVVANSLTATPTSLTYAYQIGSAAPAAQSVSIGSIVPGLAFTATPGAAWLTVTPGAGTTPQSISVGVVTTGLTPGTYKSSVTITAATASNSPLSIPVTFTVTPEPSLTATPTSLAFNYTAGTAAPPSQSIAVGTSNNASTAFTATAATSSGGNWLIVSPASGSATPASLAVSINGTGLTAGTYNGTVTIAATGYLSQTVTVSLVVTQPKATVVVTGTKAFALANTAPPATSVLTITASDGSKLPFTVATTTPPASWLTFTPAGGTTPGSVTLTFKPAGLIPGIYLSSLTVAFTGGAAPPAVVSIELTITGSNLTATPNMLAFVYQPGGLIPPAQTVQVSPISGGSVPLSSVSASTNWLRVTSATSAPATLQVSVVPGLLTAGNYQGDVRITGTGSPDTSLVIPVTLSVGTLQPLTVTPTSLTFTYQIGGTAPAAQSFALSTGASTLDYTIKSPGAWLTVSPQQGTTPGSVVVTVNPAGLAAGTYGGAIVATAYGASNNPVSIPVTLTVTGGLTATPSQLSFSSPLNGPAPPAQTVAVAGTTPVNFTVTSSASWLTATPASGTTPATLTISANPTNLGNGTYTGTVTITSGNLSAIVTVTFKVGTGVNPGAPVISGIVNAASGAILQSTAVGVSTTPLAPGTAVSVFGTGLGPQTAVVFSEPAAGGTVATMLAGTEVTFDGTPASILYTQAGQVNVLAPFTDLAGKTSTQVVVSYNGQASAAVTLQVAPAAPGLFTINDSGKGQGAILNQNTTVNSATNPAAAGSVIVIYGTGGGQTDPASTDGQINPLTDTGKLVAGVIVTIGGQTATVNYAGPAPGLVAGIIQINAVIPDGTPSGPANVVVSVGDVNSQTVTVAVQ